MASCLPSLITACLRGAASLDRQAAQPPAPSSTVRTGKVALNWVDAVAMAAVLQYLLFIGPVLCLVIAAPVPALLGKNAV